MHLGAVHTFWCIVAVAGSVAKLLAVKVLGAFSFVNVLLPLDVVVGEGFHVSYLLFVYVVIEFYHVHWVMAELCQILGKSISITKHQMPMKVFEISNTITHH